jgi:hypothetical protein
MRAMPPFAIVNQHHHRQHMRLFVHGAPQGSKPLLLQSSGYSEQPVVVVAVVVVVVVVLLLFCNNCTRLLPRSRLVLVLDAHEES